MDDVYARSRVPISRYAPLSEKICYLGADALTLIGIAWDFFQTDPNSEEIAHALHLIRQATLIEVPLEIGLLAQCTVFEGIVNILHRRTKNVDTKPEEAFSSAKAETLQFLDGKLSNNPIQPGNNPAWQRLRNHTASAQFFRLKDKFEQLCHHFSLSQDGFFNPTLKAWESHRNALAHGSSSGCDPAKLLFSSSRLAGAQYILLAKLFGYSGKILLSQVEERETTI